MRTREGLFFFLKRLVTILSLARPPGTLKASYTRLTAFIKVNSSQRSTCGTSPAYPLRDSWHISKAFTGTFHFSRLVVMVLTSSYAFFLSFSTVHLQVVSVFLFFCFLLVPKSWLCCSRCFGPVL